MMKSGHFFFARHSTYNVSIIHWPHFHPAQYGFPRPRRQSHHRFDLSVISTDGRPRAATLANISTPMPLSKNTATSPRRCKTPNNTPSPSRPFAS